MIRIDGLTKQYKSLTALDGIDLHIRPGELFAYLGPNGAGKTTTIRILTGLTTRTSGNAIEGNKYSPSLVVAFKIAHAFGYSIDSVFEYESDIAGPFDRFRDTEAGQ